MSLPPRPTPTEVAERLEISAWLWLDDGDQELAQLDMQSAHTIRYLLRALDRLNVRVHSGYDFNADPDQMTKEIAEVLKGYKP